MIMLELILEDEFSNSEVAQLHYELGNALAENAWIEVGQVVNLDVKAFRLRKVTIERLEDEFSLSQPE